MRTDTKNFKVLQFISGSNGVTSTEVAKFIVQDLNGKTWDPKRGCGMWNITLYGRGYKYPGLYKEYCRKMDGLWYLTPYAAEIVASAEQKVDVRKTNPELKWVPLSIPTVYDNRKSLEEKFEDVFHKTAPKQTGLDEDPKPSIAPLEKLVDKLRLARKTNNLAIAQRDRDAKELGEVAKKLTLSRNAATKAAKALEEIQDAIKEFLGFDE
jgi:hypothetical protein